MATPSLHDQLLEAAGGRGTDDDLRALIARGVDVKGRAGAGPLNWAVAAGRLSTVQLLLDAGASIDGVYPEHTPLMQAKSAEVARYLLERGARTDGREALRGDALDFTIARADDAEHARVLLDHGFRVEPRHLISAAKARTKILKLLLDRGGGVDGIDRDGRSMLATALVYREAETALLLVERGARVSPDDLVIACEWHDGPVVAVVLGKTTGDVTPAAERAAARDNVELLRILIESDRVVRLGDVLGAAARRGAALAFEFLLRCGADPRERDADGASALHAAARGGSITILERCLAEGCAFDLDKKGRTALHHAALGESTADMLRTLAARGLDLEARDHARDTPLATCANNLNTPAYDTLLELGADASTGETIREAKIAEDEAFVAQFR